MSVRMKRTSTAGVPADPEVHTCNRGEVRKRTQRSSQLGSQGEMLMTSNRQISEISFS